MFPPVDCQAGPREASDTPPSLRRQVLLAHPREREFAKPHIRSTPRSTDSWPLRCREIAVGRCRKQQLLREHTARRIDRDVDCRSPPAPKRGRDVGEDLPPERAVAITLRPDFTLQAFEARRFPIAIHQPFEIARRRRNVCERPGGRLLLRPGVFLPFDT